MSPYAKAPKVAPAVRHRRGGIARALVACVVTAVAAMAMPTMAQAAYVPATPPSFAQNVPNNNGSGGVAINQTTDEVYVGVPTVGGGPDPGTITRHTSAGVQQNAFGTGFYGGVAVDPVTQNVYGFNGSNLTFDGTAEITIFNSTGTPTGTPIAVEAFIGDGVPDIFTQIATDAAGNVYFPNQVDDTVEKFSPAGALLLTITGGFTDPVGAAVDGAGNVYVVDNVGPFADPTNGRLKKFDATGAAATCPATICQTSGVLSVATGPGNDVFVGKGAGTGFHIERYDSAGVQLADFGLGDFTGEAGKMFTHHQIAVNSDTGRVYASDPTGVRMYDEEIDRELTVTKGGTGSGVVQSDPTGIDCGSDCDHIYADGTEVTLVATPDTGSVVGTWTTGCDSNPTPEECVVDMTGADKAVNVNFDPEPVVQHTVTVNKTGAGAGTVTSSPAGINCGGDCTEDYDEGTDVTLTAAASPGSTFTGWSGGGCSGTGTCTLDNLADNTTVTATFVINQHTVTVNKTGTGAGTVTSAPAGINCGATCSDDFNEGTDVTLTAAPGVGSTFTGWSGGGCSGTGTCTLDNLAADTTVTATFTLTDTDGDGVPDNTDQCDTQDGPASNNGCPLPPPNTDTDKDGVPDSTDQCDNQAGPASNNGCPEPPVVDGALALASKTAAYKSGKASVKIRCTGGPCDAGKVTLKAKIKSGKKKKAKTVTIGSANIAALADGGTATIKVKLNGKAKSALGKTGKLKATASGAVKGKVTIKGGKKKKKKK
jgi:hypothetical protein